MGNWDKVETERICAEEGGVKLMKDSCCSSLQVVQIIQTPLPPAVIEQK